FDLFKITVTREEEDAALPTPQLRDLAVADEDRRGVRVVGAELEPGHSPVEEQDFLRQVEAEARPRLVLAVDDHQIAGREPPLDGCRQRLRREIRVEDAERQGREVDETGGGYGGGGTSPR